MQKRGCRKSRREGIEKGVGEDVEEQAEPDIDSLKEEIKQAVDSLSFDDTREAKKLLAKSFLALKKTDHARLYFHKVLEIKPDDYETFNHSNEIQQFFFPDVLFQIVLVLSY